MKLFGRPGHGAPTVNVRKKRFTEHQMADEQKRHLLKMQVERGGGFSWASATPGAGGGPETVGAGDRAHSPPPPPMYNGHHAPSSYGGGVRMSKSMDGGLGGQVSRKRSA